MPTNDENELLKLLQACAAFMPEPLYPSRFAKEHRLDRSQLDAGLDELRRRGLIKLTEWVRDLGQGCTLTDAGRAALAGKRMPTDRASRPDAPQIGDEGVSQIGRGETVRRAIFAPTFPYVTRALLAANLLYFAVGAFIAWSQPDLSVEDYLLGNQSPTTSKVLEQLGALRPGLVFPGGADSDQRPQYERIILFTFLHIGLLHLFMNMYFLYGMAQLIESMWGSLRFLTIYLISGIVSGCVVLLMDSGGLTAGASGCLYGAFVALMVWFYLNREYLPPGLAQDLSRNLSTNTLLLLAINFVPAVSWQGHLGGAVGGLLAALLLHVQRFHPSPALRLLALIGIPLVPLGFFVAVLMQHAGRF